MKKRTMYSTCIMIIIMSCQGTLQAMDDINWEEILPEIESNQCNLDNIPEPSAKRVCSSERLSFCEESPSYETLNTLDAIPLSNSNSFPSYLSLPDQIEAAPLSLPPSPTTKKALYPIKFVAQKYHASNAPHAAGNFCCPACDNKNYYKHGRLKKHLESVHFKNLNLEYRDYKMYSSTHRLMCKLCGNCLSKDTALTQHFVKVHLAEVIADPNLMRSAPPSDSTSFILSPAMPVITPLYETHSMTKPILPSSLGLPDQIEAAPAKKLFCYTCEQEFETDKTLLTHRCLKPAAPLSLSSSFVTKKTVCPTQLVVQQHHASNAPQTTEDFCCPACNHQDYHDNVTLKQHVASFHLESLEHPDYKMNSSANRLTCKLCGKHLSKDAALTQHFVKEHLREVIADPNLMRSAPPSDLNMSRSPYILLPATPQPPHNVPASLAIITKKYQCPECLEIFPNSTSYTQHATVSHASELKAYQNLYFNSFVTKLLNPPKYRTLIPGTSDMKEVSLCIMCKETFSEEHSYTEHTLVHHTELNNLKEGYLNLYKKFIRPIVMTVPDDAQK